MLWGGGLLSLLKTQDTGFYFDVSDPYEPSFYKSDRATLSAISDDVVAKPDGGFFFTYMGSAVGSSPGRLIETDKNYNIIHQWPEDQAGLLEVLGSQFSPHGLAVDFKKGYIWTSDFVVPLSVLKPSTGIISAETVRLWDLKTRTIINTVHIPNGGGIQDVKLIPGNKEGAVLATAVGLGQLWIIYPERVDPKTGKKGVAKLFFDLGPKARKTTAIFSAITNDGKYIYVTATTADHVYSLDISNLDSPKRLDDPNVVQPIVGPHFLKITPDQKHVVVTDYFVQTGDIGILNTPSDYKAQYIDILPNGDLSFNRSINFQQVFANRGGAKPHSTVVYDLTDPSNPKWDTGAYPGAGTVYAY